MIDRTTPNPDLLIKVNGLYQDYMLMKEHSRRKILKYLKNNFPNKNNCIKDSYVDLYLFTHNHTGIDDFQLILSTKDILEDNEIDDFCKEFGLELVKINIEHNRTVERYRKDNYKNLKKYVKLFYYFRRDRLKGVDF